MKGINSLRFITWISLAAVTALICFSIFYISPLYTDLIIKNAETEAVKVGRHLTGHLQGYGPVSRQLPEDFIKMATDAIGDFGLDKIKVFSPAGEIVYSSDAADVGTYNRHEYFSEIVARGNVYTKYVKKDTSTLEGKVVSRDLIEAYVPIMHGSTFDGAFELYLDITGIRQELSNLLFNSHSLLLLIVVGLILPILIISIMARRFLQQQKTAEQKIIQQNLALQDMNEKLQEANIQLSLLFNFTPVIICTAGTDGYFKGVNPTMVKTLGFSEEELLSRPLLDLVHPEDKHPVKKKSNIKIDGRSIYTFQNRYQCKDGSYRLLEWTTTSAVDGILYASAKDITERKLAEEEREKLIHELQKALDEIKTLQGIIPICMYCKKIKSDKGVWDQLEVYLSEHSDADFSHGCCPECYKKLIEKMAEED